MKPEYNIIDTDQPVIEKRVQVDFKFTIQSGGLLIQAANVGRDFQTIAFFNQTGKLILSDGLDPIDGLFLTSHRSIKTGVES